MKGAIVRYGTEADIPEIVRVINAAYRVEDFFVRGNRTNDEDVAGRMAASGGCFIVADSGDGVLVAATSVDVHEDRGHFAMLSVDPVVQGKGYARMMIDAVEDHCRKSGCRHLDIEVVNLREELPAFYERFGFAATSTAQFSDMGKLTREAHLVLMTKTI